MVSKGIFFFAFCVNMSSKQEHTPQTPIHQSGMTLSPPAKYCAGPHFPAKTALTCQGMDALSC